MALTIETLKALAEKTERYGPSCPNRYGCWILRPPIEVIYKPTNQIVHVKSVDENGVYPQTVHTQELGLWYPIGEFELPPRAE